MSFKKQEFVQGIANLRYRTQREPQDDDMIDGKEYIRRQILSIRCIHLHGKLLS